MGRNIRSKIRAHGGPLIRYKTADLLRVGVERTEHRGRGTRDGRAVLDGGRAIEAANVVWCTGFRPDFSGLRLPLATEDGHRRSAASCRTFRVCTSGGLNSSSCSSMLLLGVGQDARTSPTTWSSVLRLTAPQRSPKRGTTTAQTADPR